MNSWTEENILDPNIKETIQWIRNRSEKKISLKPITRIAPLIQCCPGKIYMKATGGTLKMKFNANHINPLAPSAIALKFIQFFIASCEHDYVYTRLYTSHMLSLHFIWPWIICNASFMQVQRLWTENAFYS